MTLPQRLDRIPIRWRLALVSAGLTFAILLLFAIVMGAFTARRLQADFDADVRRTAEELASQIGVTREFPSGDVALKRSDVVRVVVDVAATRDAAVRIVNLRGEARAPAEGAPDLGPASEEVRDAGPYRVASHPLYAGSLMPVAYLQYGKDREPLEATLRRLKAFLALGVLAGTVLALLAGVAVARRAMRPVGRLTRAAKGIARTGDPGVRLPKPESRDEVADLADTLDEMLMSLDAARGETEDALARQRRFVADASHELRTPLTSVLANLELLEASLDGEDREVAAAALRSSRRMRRLVADLLLLARADAGRELGDSAVDLAAVVRDAAGEVAPLAPAHDVEVEAPADARPATVSGSADELHRLALNLLENAVVHTPAGTRVRASVVRDGDSVRLEVADDGPGIAAELRDRAFERFVRGRGESGGGTGLGLAIVRAVVERHGGGVEIGEAAEGGARVVVRLPAGRPAPATPAPERTSVPGAPAG